MENKILISREEYDAKDKSKMTKDEFDMLFTNDKYHPTKAYLEPNEYKKYFNEMEKGKLLMRGWYISQLYTVDNDIVSETTPLLYNN
jgi:hypothetical protein